MPTPTVQHLELDRINAATDVQPRVGGVKEDVVDQYAEDMKAKAAFPPIVAYFDGSAYWLSEGFHRFAARRRAGFPTIAVEVRDGTKDDAHWNALGSNKDHGLRRTNEDKRQAVQLALAKRPDLSDRAIAEHVGVSNTFVGNVRGQLSTVDSSTGKRVGMDGKRRTAPTSRKSGGGSSPRSGKGKPQAKADDKPNPPAPIQPTTKDQPLNDALGQPVPALLRDDFADQRPAKYAAWMERLAEVLAEWSEHRDFLVNNDNPFFMSGKELESQQAMEHELALRVARVEAGKLHAVCPVCQGKNFKQCKECRRFGLVPDWRHTELTEVPSA